MFLDTAEEALRVDTGFGPLTVDAEAGSAVVLPPGSRTIAAKDVPVTEFAVTSAIRDVAQRELMYDLKSSLRWLQVMSSDRTNAEQRLGRAITMLRQMWA